jgi:hypothetical protein
LGLAIFKPSSKAVCMSPTDQGIRRQHIRERLQYGSASSEANGSLPPALLPAEEGNGYPLFPAIFAISRMTISVPLSLSASFSKSSVTTMRMSGRT